MNRVSSLIPRCLLFVACIFSFAAVAPAAPRAECRAVDSNILGHPVRYCVFLPPSYDTAPLRRYPVVYFLHGLGENEQILLNSEGWDLIQDLWSQKQIGEFLIVAPNGGRTFFINSDDGRVRYEDFLTQEFIPFIDSHYRTSPEKRARGVTGISMGGYGAFHLALRFPQKFESVSAHSAVLVPKLPKEDPDNPQQDLLARMLGPAFGVPFNRSFWDRNNPFTLVRDGAPTASLRIYFDCGTEDEFGFNVGAQAFHDLLASKKIPHEFHLYPGGHNWEYFAEHFPASLKFQSDGFVSQTDAK